MPGFSDTAAYFETKASKAKSEDRQRSLADAARFYRELGRITPAFPYGYKQPARVKPNGSFRADRLRNRAEECRAIAEVMRDRDCKMKLLDLAETYEKLASALQV